mmetsp:Transcript_26921/g.67533  ORF Transcript_26921/g.67533 Transcript_26921/m.67533 type:complete len:85 (-) Transcript_26921:31-285(-)
MFLRGGRIIKSQSHLYHRLVNLTFSVKATPVVDLGIFSRVYPPLKSLSMVYPNFPPVMIYVGDDFSLPFIEKLSLINFVSTPGD